MKTQTRRFSSRRSIRPAWLVPVADIEAEGAVGPSFAVCSVCLRVHEGSGWTDAEDVIREIHSFELETVPALKAGLCDRCTESLRTRRAQPPESIAA